MKILLWCDDIMSRTRIGSAWMAAGATVLRKTSEEPPDCIVMDLGARDALAHIARLRSQHPSTDIIAFGPHFDGDAFKAAKGAGATEVAARSSIVERISRRLPRP